MSRAACAKLTEGPDLDGLRSLEANLRRTADEIAAFIAIAAAIGPASPFVAPRPEFLPIAAVARLLGKSKEAVRKQAKRRALAERIDGQLYIRSDVASLLYSSSELASSSCLSAYVSTLSNVTSRG